MPVGTGRGPEAHDLDFATMDTTAPDGRTPETPAPEPAARARLAETFAEVEDALLSRWPSPARTRPSTASRRSWSPSATPSAATRRST